LTIPEKVTTVNIKKLKKFVANGPKYPGANYLITVDGKRKKITEDNVKELIKEVEIGCVVERHLLDGDIVLFNRQPSLHRMSIMAHKVRVMPGKTFRLHLSVCPPYNADFDGDEMNLHVPQTEEARTEARFLMEVQSQIRSPRFGGPIIGCIHDQISGSYMLTKKDTTLDKEEVYQLLKVAGLDDVKLPKPAEGKRWTGKQIFSLLIPKEVNTQYKAKWCRNCDTCAKEKCPYDAYVKIKNGKLLCGVIDEKSIGAFTGRLLDQISRISPEETRKFLDRLTKLVTYFLMTKGFTTGIEDEDLPEYVREKIKKVLDEAQEKVDDIIEKYRAGELEPRGGTTIEETLEELIMATLNEGRDKAGAIAEEYLKETNYAVVMARTGARGNIDRTLPHFKPKSLRADACGFVSSSYKKGMGPIEFFFHAMGGRESLTDTAMRTPKSGYMQRRLVNALQDLITHYDYTVKDNRGTIVQFGYGEDRIDPAKSDWGNLNIQRILESV
jgi:DNA-directed RNA polymerase subunit A'